MLDTDNTAVSITVDNDAYDGGGWGIRHFMRARVRIRVKERAGSRGGLLRVHQERVNPRTRKNGLVLCSGEGSSTLQK